MINFDSFGQSDGNSSDAGTASYSFDNVGGNIIVVACIMDSASQTVDTNGVLYDGDVLTELVDLATSATRLWVGYLVSPSKGSNTVAVNFTGTLTAFRTAALTFSGVDTTTPIGGENNTSDTGTTTPIDTTVTVTGDDGMIVDFFSSTRCTGGNAESPQTEKMAVTGTWGGGVEHLGGASYEAHTGSNTTVSWENLTDLSVSSVKLQYAVELLPAPFTPKSTFIM
jgi:hypothetical protein